MSYFNYEIPEYDKFASYMIHLKKVYLLLLPNQILVLILQIHVENLLIMSDKVLIISRKHVGHDRRSESSPRDAVYLNYLNYCNYLHDPQVVKVN